jgi:hypothetical protein
MKVFTYRQMPQERILNLWIQVLMFYMNRKSIIKKHEICVKSLTEITPAILPSFYRYLSKLFSKSNMLQFDFVLWVPMRESVGLGPDRQVLSLPGPGLKTFLRSDRLYHNFVLTVVCIESWS